MSNLQGADLTEDNLQGANLSEANLQGANLTGARGVDATQVLGASLDTNTSMPNGMKYEEWVAKGKPDWAIEKAEKKATRKQKRTKPGSTDKG